MIDGLILLFCGAIAFSIPVGYAISRKRFKLALKIIAVYAITVGIVALWQVHQELANIAGIREHGFYDGAVPSLLGTPLGFPLIAGGFIHLVVRRKLSAVILFLSIVLGPVYLLSIHIPFLFEMWVHGTRGLSWFNEIVPLLFALVPLPFILETAYAATKMEGTWL